MSRIIPNLAFSYRKLPFRPFKKLLRKVYDVYVKYNRGKTVICTVDEITYELDLNEMIDSEIFYNGCFEPDTTMAIYKVCEKEMTVLDIGANIGCHTFRFSKLVGSKGKVIAFEPTSFAFKKLERNLHLNNAGNVVLEKIALSDENKTKQEVSFRSSWPLDHKNRSGIHPVDHGQMGLRDIVSFFKLDDYVRQKELNRVDIIKLDVDGYEYRIIQGSIETLKLHQPILIVELFSYTHEEIGDSVFDLVTLLSNLGYSFYSIKDMRMLSKNFVNNHLQSGEGFNSIILRAE